MSIPATYRQLAEELGVVQRPEQSDAQFMQWLDNLRKYRSLVARAKSFGTVLTPSMTAQEVRQRFLGRQRELLEQRGMVPGAEVTLNYFKPVDVRITEIAESQGRDAKLVVKYWIIRWIRRDNRGRANHAGALLFLEKGILKK
jgi:hypothetical protein